MCDQVDCRLEIAKNFLDRIEPSIPKENSFEHFLLEANAGAFLFFSSSVIDMIKVEINNEFNLFDRENVFYIHGVRKRLGNTGIQKQIKDVIAKYFSIPTHRDQPDTGSERTKTGPWSFDTTCSALWELQTLRNKAVHGKIFNIIDQKISIDFTIRCSGDQKKYTIIAENPNRYFLQIFESASSFVRQIRLLNPQKSQSVHHMEHLDFKIE
jgi:hypothetical protein